jgi:nitrite reductase/ring-hydroxylating ferredoxin subunit
MGVALTLAVTFSWPDGGTPPQTIAAGEVQDFAPGSVTTFPEEEFHLVRLPDGEFLALSMLDPHGKLLVEEGLAPSPCLVPWRPDFEFLGRKGWFRNPCHGETYDLTGTCFSGPCPRGLDRFSVMVEDGKVLVDPNALILGPTRPGAQGTPTPATPPSR